MRGIARLGLAITVTTALACYNVRHAEVQLRGNAAGAECFAACQRFPDDAHVVDCVATCPGASRSCDGLACAETRTFSKAKTALLVIGAGLVLVMLTSTSSSSDDGGPQ
jgi:hypothetical protein